MPNVNTRASVCNPFSPGAALSDAQAAVIDAAQERLPKEADGLVSNERLTTLAVSDACRAELNQVFDTFEANGSVERAHLFSIPEGRLSSGWNDQTQAMDKFGVVPAVVMNGAIWARPVGGEPVRVGVEGAGYDTLTPQ